MSVENWMLPGERLDDLMRGNLRILQKPQGFCFGMDSVLLAWFASQYVKKGRAVDLGTGSGILPLLLSARAPGLSFDAIEVQPDIAGMAARSVALNGLTARIRVHAMDLLDAPKVLGHECCRLAVSNPPYGANSLPTPDAARSLARHESTATIGDICLTAGRLLQNGGHFCLVFPAGRLLFLLDALRAARLEPKHLCFIHPRPSAAPNLVLVDAIKAAKPLLHYLPPLFVRGEDGLETAQIRSIYQEE